jgi:hypothetical protein
VFENYICQRVFSLNLIKKFIPIVSVLSKSYRVAHKSVNLKDSLVLKERFRIKAASQVVEQCHSLVSCALNMEDLMTINFCKFRK